MATIRTEKLTLLSGDVIRVRMSLSNRLMIKSCLEEFRQELKGRIVYPATQVDVMGEAVHETIYADLREYFIEFGKSLIPAVNADEVEPLSRHSFFVCSGEIPHWSEEGRGVSAPSQFELLLGYEYSKPGISATSSAPPLDPPSGEYELYLLAALALNFPSIGLDLADRYDTDTLSAIIRDAAYISDPDRKKDKYPEANIRFQKSHIADSGFENSKDDVRNRLKALNVNAPEDF